MYLKFVFRCSIFMVGHRGGFRGSIAAGKFCIWERFTYLFSFDVGCVCVNV